MMKTLLRYALLGGALDKGFVDRLLNPETSEFGA